MRKKYLNEAVIGNKNIVASFNKKGEMLRLFYPTRDYRQFVDTMTVGVKVNDSSFINLYDDINNIYEQHYSENTNVLNTQIENTYFNLQVFQTDFVCLKEDVIVKKYTFVNNNTIDLNVDLLIYSKLLSSFNNMVGSKVENDIFMQYSHSYTFSIFSKNPILGYRLNNSSNEIESGTINDKDYVAMANDAAVSFNVGTIKPGQTKQIDIFIHINDNKKISKFDEIEKNVNQIKKMNTEDKLEEVKKHWRKYTKEHDTLKVLNEKENAKWKKRLNFDDRKMNILKRVYSRSILLFPLLSNSATGGISAALEVDEEKDKSGRYSYCWPRDAVFVSKALDILNMTEITDKFYEVFSKQTQSENGMWEQRFYTDGKFAPSWGYQIDETASIVFGVYSHYYKKQDKQILINTLEMNEKAVKFLQQYIDYICEGKSSGKEIFTKNESYDLWEMNEGIHLYSLSAIYAAFNVMQTIYKILEQKLGNIEKLEEYKTKIKKYCMENLYNKETKVLKRNTRDDVMDISMLGAITPFRMLDVNQPEVVNTIEKMEMTLQTYTKGYLRFEHDNYMGGNNPWVIATLWKMLYDIKKNDTIKVQNAMEFILNTATEHGFLSEQVDNSAMKANWVIGLAWSHAMFITALYSIDLQ